MKRVVLINTFALLFSLLFPSTARAENLIDSVSIEKNTYSVGETVYWDIDASCSTGNTYQLSLVLNDPLGIPLSIRAQEFNGSAFQITPKGPYRIPLKITKEASPGKYTVNSVVLGCMNGNTSESILWKGDLDSLSFILQPEGLMPATTQPQLEKIEMTTPAERTVGDTISIHVIARNTGKIHAVWVWMCNQLEDVEISKIETWYDLKITGDATRTVDTTINFEVGVDWPSGTWSICRVVIQGYAGVDFTTPWGFDANPTNTTAIANRSADISNKPGQSSSFQPQDWHVEQADISKIKVNITNSATVLRNAPEITNVSLSTTNIKAGDSFQIKMDADGKGANIYQLFGSFVNKLTNIGYFSCDIKGLGDSPFVEKMTGVLMTCKSSRATKPGTYWINQLSVYSTSCSGTIRDIASNEGQSCQQQPKQRITSYFPNYIESNPDSKEKLINPLTALPPLVISEPGELLRQELQNSTTTESQVVFRYVQDYEMNCSYHASAGMVETDGLKGDGSVRVLGVKPNTEVKLSASCRSTDGLIVNFTDSAKTTLPKPPTLPYVIESKADLYSVNITLGGLNLEDNSYEFESSAGDVLLLVDVLEIMNLSPSQSISITTKVTDSYGQESEGLLTTIKSSSPPILKKPRVTLVNSSNGIYLFKFIKLASLKYQLKTVNCLAKIYGTEIRVTKLLKHKNASVTLTVSDTFNQSASYRFFQFSSK